MILKKQVAMFKRFKKLIQLWTDLAIKTLSVENQTCEGISGKIILKLGTLKSGNLVVNSLQEYLSILL